MDKITCIILNYNDADTTLALLGELKEFSCLDSIVVVDNCSSDDSWERLKPLDKTSRLHILRTEHNGGYGMGNQAGIDYAVRILDADYAIIANPDIHVTQDCILRIKAALDKDDKAVLASARVKNDRGDDLFSYWTLLPLWKDLLDTGLLTRRIFWHMLNTPPFLLPAGPDKDSRLVDAVPGSFYIIKLGALTPGELSSFYDPRLFLYCEEKVLGQKFREKGLHTLLVTDQAYIHAHSVSIDKSYRRIVDKQKLLHKSKLYYYKEYLHASPVQMAAARLALGLVLAEVWFLTVVCNMRW